MFEYDMNAGWKTNLAMGSMMALMVVLIVGALWVLARSRGRSPQDERGQAQTELELRYARGELSHEEFEERRGRLGG